MSTPNNRSDIVFIQKTSALCLGLFPRRLRLFSFCSSNSSLPAPSICSHRLASAFMSRARVCVCTSVCLCLCVTYCPHMKVNIISPPITCSCSLSPSSVCENSSFSSSSLDKVSYIPGCLGISDLSGSKRLDYKCVYSKCLDYGCLYFKKLDCRRGLPHLALGFLCLFLFIAAVSSLFIGGDGVLILNCIFSCLVSLFISFVC